MKQKPSPAQLAEREVTKQVRDFLEWRGWRPVRHQRTAIPGSFSTGEPGMPDYCMIHYLEGVGGKLVGVSLVLWIEMKREGARMRCNCRESHTCTMHAQMKWRAREEKRGAIVAQVASLSMFEPWYLERFGWLHRAGGVGQLDLFALQEGVPA